MKSEVKEQIASDVTEQIYSAYPDLWNRFGEHGYKRTKEDNHHHLDHLETAFELKQPTLFLGYTEWLVTVLTSRNIGTNLIIDNFNRLLNVIPGNTGQDEENFMTDCLREAIRQLKQL